MRALLKLPARARLLLGSVIVGGVAAVAIRVPAIARWSSLDIAAAAAVALGVAAASHLALGLRHETEIENFDLTDSFLVAGLLLVKPSVLTIAVALGNVVGQMSRRWAPHKIAFNIGSNLVAITAAEGVFTVLRHPAATAPVGWAAALVGMAAFFVVNATSVAMVIALVEERSVVSVIRPGLALDLVHWLGNVAIGILIARTWTTDRRLLPVLIVPMAVSWLAYRAWLRGIRESERMRDLYESGRALSGSLTEALDLRPFLKLVVRMLDADDAQLALVEGGDMHLYDPSRSVVLHADGDPRGIGALVSSRPGFASHHAKVGEGERERGALVVYRRDPFTDAESSLVDTLARQLFLKLENRRLFVETVGQRTELANLVASTTNGIVGLDPDGTIRAWNPAMASITGFGEEEAAGRRIDELLGLRAHPAPGGEDEDAEITLRDGTKRWIRCSSNRLADAAGNGGGAVMVVRDVTAELDTERLKANFIATISHELRTPLTPLKGFLVALKKGTVADTPEVRAEYYDIMLNQTDRLERLIGDLLAVSQIEADTLQLERQVIDLPTVLADEERLHEGAADGREVRFGLPMLPVFAHGDAGRVAQVLRHLLSNAAKFSPPEEPVDVTLEVTDTMAVVSVTDRGAGIPESEQNRIFDAFHRTENGSTRSTNGAGLGLYIAKRLVEAMDGKLWVESAPGRGSTFLFSLPLAKATGGHAGVLGRAAR